MDTLDWPKVLSTLEGFASSEVTRLRIRQLEPFGEPQSAKSNLEEVTQAKEVLLAGRRPFMESLDLYQLWHQRLERKAVLKGLEIKDVRHFCLEVMALHEILGAHKNRWAEKIGSGLMKADEPLSAIDQILSPDGSVRMDASEVLFALTEEKKRQTKQVQVILDRLVKDYKLENVLQDSFVTTREGRWVLPVKSGMQHDFEGIIHSASQSKQTVFMEPKETVALNNRLREIETQIEAEVDRLLQELTTYLFSLLSDFQRTRDVLAETDLRLAQAQLALQLEATAPEFSPDSMWLSELRHPLLVFKNQKVVANTVELTSERRVLLLSGPNAGGKTILLKSIGLAAQMARCGLHICAAPRSHLPFFKDIIVAIGDSQSVESHLSTFAAHLNLLDRASKLKGMGSLVLVDEICGATDPEEGAALARSFIEAYAANKAFSVITSHLGNLRKQWAPDLGVINGSLEFDSVKGPTYRFLMGVPGQSLAIRTAERVGVSQPIVDRALHLLSPEHRKYQKDIKEAERLREELEHMRESLDHERIHLEKEKAHYQALNEKLERDRDELIASAVKKAEGEIEDALRKAKAEQVFKRHQEGEKLKAQLPQIIKTREEPQIKTAQDFANRYPPGSKVFVSSIGRDGVIQGGPNAKGEIPILSNSMRLFVSWENLKPAKEAQNPTTEILRRSPQFGLSPADSDRVVDLRGNTAEEALEHLELQLDAAALAKEDRIKVIHGHGTDTLKRSVRSYLSRSVYVKKWSAGTPESGGDGVTWIELND